MTPPYRQPAIKDIGLRAHLENRKKQADDFGYSEFTKMVRVKMNATNIAKAFGVDRHTIAKWQAIYFEEQNSVE